MRSVCDFAINGQYNVFDELHLDNVEARMREYMIVGPESATKKNAADVR